MSSWSIAQTAVKLVLLVLLALVTRRDKRFLPLLVFLVFMAAVDELRPPLGDITREQRFLWHTDQALYLSVYFGFLLACTELFELRAGRWLAPLSWVGFMVGFVAGYGTLSAEDRAYVYAAAAVVTLLGCWGVVIRAIVGRSDVQPSLAHLVAMVLIAGDTVSALPGLVDLSPGGTGAFAASWDAINAVNVVSLGLGAVICCIRLARP